MTGRYGSYGADRLNRALTFVAVAIMVLSFFIRSQVINVLMIATVVFMMFRTFSRNYAARQRENAAYARLANKVTPAWNKARAPLVKAGRGVFLTLRGTFRRVVHFRTHRYYKCPGCGRELRVPKVDGLIEITCPKCGKWFVKGKRPGGGK